MTTPSSDPIGPQPATCRQDWSPLLKALPQGVLLLDAGGRYLEVNPAGARILGADRETLLARSLPEPWAKVSTVEGTLLPPEDFPSQVALRTGIPVRQRTLGWTRNDGRTLWLEVTAEPLRGGGALLSFHDITGQRLQSRRLERLTQLYAALSQVNQAIVWSPTRQALLDKICQVMVEFGKFAMAWIGWNDPETHEVRVASSHGDRYGYLDRLRVRTDASPLGQGGTGTAIREARTCVINDFLGSPVASPWHEAARQSGFAASVAIPIRFQGQVAGALMAYASEKDFFGTEEIKLLEEAAGDVAFALDTLELAAQHKLDVEALREQEARYRAQFSLAGEGIITHDFKGNFIEINEAFARMHGYAPEEMTGMNLRDFDYSEVTRNVAAERMARIRAGEVLTFEVEHLHRDGHVFPLEVSASLVPSGGKSVIIAFHRDITERKGAEREKDQIQTQLLQSQKMESLGILAGGIAHDMNNVLGAILGMASANIEDQPVGSRLYRAFNTIANAAIRGGKVVKSLLNFARSDPGELREIHWNDLLREEADLLERTTMSRIHLELSLAGDLGLMRGDASALTHAVMNLCVNAVDAMPDGGTLALRTRNVDGAWIEVLVEDTGTGMPREVLEKAVDPFFTTKGVGKGTGLGLSMVYSAVKAHQGQLEIQSEPGQGTRVSLRFPTCEPSAPIPGPGEAHGPAKASPGGLGVLVVDDDELIRSSTQAILAALGHQATTASSGEAALRELEGGLRPGVVILDMNMPGLGGAGTLPRLRALLPEVPVLLSTGRIDQMALDLAALHPGVTLLSKPFTMRELQHQLQSLAPD